MRFCWPPGKVGVVMVMPSSSHRGAEAGASVPTIGAEMVEAPLGCSLPAMAVLGSLVCRLCGAGPDTPKHRACEWALRSM
jgi:hypothetical protein